MRYVSFSEVLKIHRRIIESSGGALGIRDLGAIDLNGYEIDASTDEQEEIVLGVAAGEIDRISLTAWLKQRTIIFRK